MQTTDNSNTLAQSQPLLIERNFDLPLSRVWEAWSKEETFKKWWGPRDYTCPKCTIDFRVGGKMLACMKSKDGQETWSTGTFKEIISGKSFVVTDSFSDEKGNHIAAEKLGMPGKWPDECLLTVILSENNGKTNMKIRHEGIPQEMHDDCVNGWNESLDKLEKI